eukprot:2857082-Amphidinium_carterae.1
MLKPAFPENPEALFLLPSLLLRALRRRFDGDLGPQRPNTSNPVMSYSTGTQTTKDVCKSLSMQHATFGISTGRCERLEPNPRIGVLTNCGRQELKVAT